MFKLCYSQNDATKQEFESQVKELGSENVRATIRSHIERASDNDFIRAINKKKNRFEEEELRRVSILSNEGKYYKESKNVPFD